MPGSIDVKRPEPSASPPGDRRIDAFLKGSGGARADDAAASAPGDVRSGDDVAERQDKLLDEGVEETFPASDPVSVKRIT